MGEKEKEDKKACSIRGRSVILNALVRVGFTAVACKPRPGKSERTGHGTMWEARPERRNQQVQRSWSWSVPGEEPLLRAEGDVTEPPRRRALRVLRVLRVRWVRRVRGAERCRGERQRGSMETEEEATARTQVKRLVTRPGGGSGSGDSVRHWFRS